VRKCPKKRGWTKAQPLSENPISTMTQTKTPGTTACVPVYDTCAQCPDTSKERNYAPPTCSVCSRLPQGHLAPDLRSPSDVFHSEAYLMRCLVKLYGWRVLEPGNLRRGRRANQTRQAPALAGAASEIASEVAA
jgi:hypothetical protein